MNRIGTWISSTLIPSVRNSLKSQFQLHTDPNTPKVGEPIKSILNQLGLQRESCWVDVRVPRNHTKNFSDRKPPRNCSFGVLCNRPPPRITRIMAKEIPKKTLPIETKSTSVHLTMERKNKMAEKSYARPNEK
ncbi:hypothetical protein KPH14_012542 [Odynerus spinipes]|uniref:Uncharacterized protein n=1 Tax=Odynerus spinipes TaxID=1348599 RepID=A0AAD9RIL0_9HYME|nr:hypothetical protein KPH14_012542 [Odynerus spinipes]